MKTAALFISIVFLIVTKTLSQNGFVGENPKIAYWTIGEPDEIFVMVHGGPGIAHNYLRPEFDRLSAMGQVIYYDQRGAGLSGKNDDYTWHSHVYDLNSLITTLASSRKIILVGSSWGVHLALLYTLQHQDRVKAIVLSGATPWESMNAFSDQPSYDSMMILSNQIRLSFNEGEYLALDSAIQKNRKNIRSGAENGTDSIFQERLAKAGRNERATHETLRSLKDMPEIEALKEIQVPVLLINGGEKCLIDDGSSELKQILKNSTLHTLSESCHDPWYNETNAFFKICEDFISSIK